MNYENATYHLKCIRIMFDEMKISIDAKIIYSYFKTTLGRWLEEVTEHQNLVGLQRVYNLKKEILKYYLCISDI